MKSLEIIRKRIRAGESVVMTAMDLKARVARGEPIGVRDVDVVTCGTCVHTCAGQASAGEFGSLPVGGKEIPIVLRQSDRARAERLCSLLKERSMDGQFIL